jgi:hypothetical protein
MGSEWPISSDSRWKSAGDRDRRVLALARSQQQLVTNAQLLEAGFSAGAIRHRILAKRWFPVRAGVYSLAPPPLPADARLMGAVLACGAGTAVSDLASAWLFGLIDTFPRIIDVTNASGRGRGRPGLRIHRRQIEPVDVTSRRGIPALTAARTIADLAATLPPRNLEQMLLLAGSRRLLDEGRLRELASSGGRRGSPALREALGLEVPFVRSPVEATFVGVCKDIGTDAPLVNRTIEVAGRRFEVDFHWPDLRLIVEIDGYAFHGGRSRANSDRDRDQVLSMAGWLIVRFTRDQVVGDPAEVGRRLLGLYRRQKSLADTHR